MDWDTFREKTVAINNKFTSSLTSILTVGQMKKLEDYYQKQSEERSQQRR